ncbi:phage portal protein family protein, partial [Acinetobacter radioresistens]|uniref:phage portal protein family protein n=2 Tax=Acinetobacter radioresistens TaxID=40216 RepID=UPI000C328814
MAKSKKDKASKKALSYGNLYTQEAVTQFLVNFGKQPDTDEVLRKAGITRHRLRVLLDDDEIAQVVETRIDALLATPLRIEPGDTKEAEMLNLVLKEWFHEIATGAMSALFFGYSVQEAVYEVKPEGYVGLQWIGEKPMQWFEPKNDGRLIYRQDGINGEHEVDQVFKFFLTRRKASYEQPYGKALLATLYWLFFFKQNGFKFWAKFLERFGTPILLGKCKDTETDDMSKALLNAHAQSVLSIDIEDDVQILSAPGTNGSAGAAFEAFNNQLIRQIQKVVLGQTLTSSTDGKGSYSLGQVHENVRMDKLKSDIRLVTPTLQAVVNALCALNGWGEYEVMLGEKPKPLNKDQAERDVHLKNAGANLSDDYFIREYGLQEGDLKSVTDLNQPDLQFKALPHKAFSFAANARKLSPEQQEVEELTDAQHNIELLSNAQVNELLQKSGTPEELAFHLMQLMPEANQSQFTANLERALYAGDVLGYMTASEGK